jgi:hypothetical protein
MAQLTHKKPWKDELWNVSLLPTVTAAADGQPPRGPGPAGGTALESPAVLSLREMTQVALPKAA